MNKQEAINILLLRVLTPPQGDTRRLVDMVAEGRSSLPDYKMPGRVVQQLIRQNPDVKAELAKMTADDFNCPWDAPMWLIAVCDICKRPKDRCNGRHIP